MIIMYCLKLHDNHVPVKRTKGQSTIKCMVRLSNSNIIVNTDRLKLVGNMIIM